MPLKMALQQSARLLRSAGFLVFKGEQYQINFVRTLTTKSLTKTIKFMTNSDQEIKKSTKGPLKLEGFNSEGRPLSVLLCWLMSKPRAVNKYAKLYLDKGYDVITIQITPSQLLWPKLSVPDIRDDLLPLLENIDHDKKVIHGFSVGGYVFGQLLKYMDKDMERYRPLKNSIAAHIWDSVCDIEGTAIGVSKSVFPKSDFLQKSLQNYIEGHLKVLRNVATIYYEDSHEYFYYHAPEAPALFMCSLSDQISSFDVIKRLQSTWIPKGINVTTKSWENTPHVGHFAYFPDEYRDALYNFLRANQLLPETSTIKTMDKMRNIPLARAQYDERERVKRQIQLEQEQQPVQEAIKNVA